MSAVLDLPTVRRFTDELREDAARCGNGEGMECSTLDAKIRHFASLCWKLRDAVREWAQSVYRGRIALDLGVEALYREAIASLLIRAKSVAEEATTNEDECYQFDWFQSLLHDIHHLEFLDTHWRTPQLAVAPGPRVPLTPAAIEEGLRVIQTLRALPADWMPKDPEQRDRLRQIRELQNHHHG